MATTATDAVPALRIIRRALLAILVFGTAGMSTELVLIGHYEDPLQIIPLAVGAAAGGTVAWVALRPSIVAIRALQFLMLSFIATGITGMTVHFNANAEFQREIDPGLSGFLLFWKVVEATAPPALAPGVLMQLGLIGLLYTYNHPALADEPFNPASRRRT